MLLFSAMSSPPVSAADSSVQARADKASTTTTTTVDINVVNPIEVQTRADWVRESVGRHVLNIQVRNFEPVNELAGYRKVIERPKIDTYTGMGNTRAREQV
jgi:hypothetical protein